VKTALFLFCALAAALAAAVAYGMTSWQAATRNIRARMNTARLPAGPAVYSERELDGLPEPVQRYFRAVLRDGQRMIAVARFAGQGQFRRSEAAESWAPFRATQMVTVQPPAFDWDARIAWLPGVRMLVRDAYVARSGILHATAFGLVTVAQQRGTPELAQGELMRFLAEAPWYPTALLPSQGVHWEAIDSSTARASLTDGPTTVSLDFHFDAAGLVTEIRSQGRYRLLNGVPILTPWQGRFSSYDERSGIRIPLEGEVAWVTPSSPLPYWRGRIVQISYELEEGRHAGFD
jgi:hypothetical protein